MQRPLPKIQINNSNEERDDLVKMSNQISIILHGKARMRIGEYIEQIIARFRFQNLITYYESFNDEV